MRETFEEFLYNELEALRTKIFREDVRWQIEREVERRIEAEADHAWQLYSAGDPLYMSKETARKVFGPEIKKKTWEEMEDEFNMNFPHDWVDMLSFEKQAREEYNYKHGIEEEDE